MFHHLELLRRSGVGARQRFSVGLVRPDHYANLYMSEGDDFAFKMYPLVNVDKKLLKMVDLSI